MFHGLLKNGRDMYENVDSVTFKAGAGNLVYLHATVYTQYSSR